MSVTGVTAIDNTTISCPIAATGNAVVDINGCVINGTISSVTPAIVSVYNSRMVSGANACITTTSTGLTTIEGCVLDSSGAAAIAGTGAIEMGSITFNDVSVIAGTITYDNASLFAASNVNVENILFLKGSAGSAGQVLTSNGVAAPTWQAGGGGGFAWAAASADGSLVNGNGVINTKAGLLTMTLPATAAVGTVIAIQGCATGATGWKIAQNAGQNIQLGTSNTTPGVGGYLASTTIHDGVQLLCVVADTSWEAISVIGNITVV